MTGGGRVSGSPLLLLLAVLALVCVVVLAWLGAYPFLLHRCRRLVGPRPLCNPRRQAPPERRRSTVAG